MIGTTTYLTAQCDACKLQFGHSHATEEEQLTALAHDYWLVVGKFCFCQKCLKIFHTIKEAKAIGVQTAAEAEIKAALDFGKTAEQHLASGDV